MAKILVVEDEQALNEAYRLILEKEGYTVETAFDGQQALDKAADFNPDLILLDLRMPNMNGLDFLKTHTGHKNKSKQKIIIFSNMDAQADVDEAYKHGANRYMLKSWASPKELTQLVKDTLKEK